MDLKKLTVLHSNDMHGDFMPEQIDEQRVGGLSLLSGYIRKVREEEENVIYVIAGDILQGSLIDTEFMGVSTIDLVNLLNPDVVSLGNHELDYGFGHLMFLARCAKFPIVNANLHVKNMDARLFDSHIILNVNGINILFIGILTEEILDIAGIDPILGTFVDVAEAAKEVEFIVNNYKRIDIDLTVLLTHIGIEEDRKLAQLLSPDLSVDLIIGGHTHTYMEQPEIVNGIVIAQAGTGTDHLGRFDLTINMDINRIADFTWSMVDINENSAPPDEAIDAVIKGYLTQTEKKYNRILSALPLRLEHEDRYIETALGNAVADSLQDAFGIDLFILGSGSLRTNGIGPLVTVGDLRTLFPYDDKAICLTIKGKVLRDMLQFFYRAYAANESLEYYQYSKGTRIVYDKATGAISELEICGEPLNDERIYTVAFQDYHIINMPANFGAAAADLPKVRPDRVVATSCRDILQERISNKLFYAQREGRIVEKEA